MTQGISYLSPVVKSYINYVEVIESQWESVKFVYSNLHLTALEVNQLLIEPESKEKLIFTKQGNYRLWDGLEVIKDFVELKFTVKKKDNSVTLTKYSIKTSYSLANQLDVNPLHVYTVDKGNLTLNATFKSTNNNKTLPIIFRSKSISSTEITDVSQSYEIDYHISLMKIISIFIKDIKKDTQNKYSFYLPIYEVKEPLCIEENKEAL